MTITRVNPGTLMAALDKATTTFLLIKWEAERKKYLEKPLYSIRPRLKQEVRYMDIIIHLLKENIMLGDIVSSQLIPSDENGTVLLFSDFKSTKKNKPH